MMAHKDFSQKFSLFCIEHKVQCRVSEGELLLGVHTHHLRAILPTHTHTHTLFLRCSLWRWWLASPSNFSTYGVVCRTWAGLTR